MTDSSHHNRGTFNPNICLTCDREKDIPGFFCSHCADQNAQATPLSIKSKLVMELHPGESGFVCPNAIFDRDSLYWIVGNASVLPEDTPRHSVYIIREFDGEYFFDPHDLPHSQIVNGWPEDFLNLWLTVIYRLEDDDESDAEYP